VVVEKVDDDAQHNSATKGEWEVDAAATEKRRQEMLNERTEKAQPVSEWYDEERERIRNEEDLIEDVKKTYESSMRMSEKFATFFRNFWDLPEDFEFDLSEKAEQSLDNRFDSGLRPMWDSFTRRQKTWLDVDDEPYVPYTWTDRSIQDLPGPEATFRQRDISEGDD